MRYIFLKISLFILFIFGCVGSSQLREGPLQSRRAGSTPCRGARAPHRGGLSCRGAQAPGARAQQLRPAGSRAHAGSAAVAHGPSRSAAREIPPDQGPNPCPLNRQADSQPLRHQGSPMRYIFGCYLYTTFP